MQIQVGVNNSRVINFGFVVWRWPSLSYKKQSVYWIEWNFGHSAVNDWILVHLITHIECKFVIREPERIQAVTIIAANVYGAEYYIAVSWIAGVEPELEASSARWGITPEQNEIRDLQLSFFAQRQRRNARVLKNTTFLSTSASVYAEIGHCWRGQARRRLRKSENVQWF